METGTKAERKSRVMLSAQTIKELEQAIETERNGCQLEVQVPNGQTFTVILQPGRAQQLTNRQQQQEEQNNPQFGAGSSQQRRGQQEWRIRKVSQQNYQD